MKKWLIALSIFLLIAAVIAAIAGFQLNSRYGWMASSAIYHDTLATPDTRLRVAVDALRLGRDIEPYLPDNIPLPAWLPWDIPTLLPSVLPREIALLGHSDFRDSEYKLTLFVNEQRGGPTLPTYLNTQTRFKENFSAVQWNEPGFVLEGRGILRADGHIEMPARLEERIRENWSPEPPDGLLLLNGGHVAEAVIDNRNGELVTLIGTLAPLYDTSLDQLMNNPQIEAAFALLAGVLDLRLAIDFESADSVLIQLRASAEPETGGQLEFLVPMVLPMLAKQVNQQYGLTMETETRWDIEESTYIIDTNLIGVEEKLRAYFQRAIPSAPPAPQTATP